MKNTKDNKIKSIVEISKLVTSSRNFFEIKDKIVEIMLKVIHPTKACINLFFKNNYNYAYLVCSSTLDYIPKLYSRKLNMDSIKINFDEYPKYIHEAVFKRKVVLVKNIFEDERAVLERPIAEREGYIGRIVFPLIANNNVVGFITCYLKKGENLSPEDINFVSSIASLAGLSIEITKKNSDVDTLIRKLRGAINYISKATEELYINKKIDSFLALISKQICKLTLSESSIIILNDIENKTQRFNQYGKEDINIHKALEIILKEKIKQNGRYYNTDSIKKEIINKNVKSLIYYTLKRGNNIIGYIASANSKKYSADDLKILSVFSSQVGVALEMYLNSKNEFEHKLLEKELEIVSHQQQLIMDENNIKFSDSKEISFFHKPSKYIGGDFCEIFKINENKVCIFVADVMGHGILSNYFVAMIKGVLKTLVHDKKSPGEILTQMNRILYNDFDKVNIFATARVAMLDCITGNTVVANAGHHYPIGVKVCEGNVIVEELNFDKGIPIGVLESTEYEEIEYNANQYELISIFTDGIIEAFDDKGEEYGIDRLKEFIYKNYKLSINNIFENLKKELFEFTKKDYLDDDLLILFIKKY